MRLVPVLLLLASPLLAAVGPEFPVGEPITAEAAFGQIEPSVASNGRTFFAVWIDQRNGRLPALLASAVDATGRFASPFGVQIATNVYRAAVASNGREYLVIWSHYGGETYSQRFRDDGTPLAPPVDAGGGFIYSLESNGSEYLALMSNAGSYEFAAAFFDADGNPRGRVDVGRMNDPALVSLASRYQIVDEKWTCDGTNPCRVNLQLTTIDPGTRKIERKDLGLETSQWARVDAIAARDRIFIAVAADGPPGSGLGRTVTIMAIAPDGTTLVAPRVVASLSATCICGSAKPSLAWDGREVLVGWPVRRSDLATESDARVEGLRFTLEGAQIDARPFAVTQFISSEFVSATASSGVLIVSSEQRRFFEPYFYGPPDLFSRGASSLAQLQTPLAESVIQSAPMQDEPQVAASGSRAVIVWREHDQPSAIRAAVADIAHSQILRELTIAERATVPRTGPAVAILGNTALITWRDEARDGVRIFGRRIDLDGRPLDAQPILISHIAESNPSQGDTAIATDGSLFLVVWNIDQEVMAARVLPDGSVSPGVIQVSRDSEPIFHRRIGPRVVWTGSVFLVTWSDDISSHLLTSPPTPPRTIVRTARVTSSGAVVDAVDSPRLVDAFGNIARVAIAANASRVMLVWAPETASGFSSDRCVRALPLDAEGRPLSEPRVVDCEQPALSSDHRLEPAVVAREEGFAVFWSGERTHDVRGRILTVDAETRESIVVSAPPHVAWNPAAATSALGIIVVYNRIADEPRYGNVPRLFGRVIDRAPPGRSRGVRSR